MDRRILLAICFTTALPLIGGPFTFTTGNPDARAGLASRPGAGPSIEIETADDFITNATGDIITGATFTGLIPTGLPLSGINFAGVEIYRVFPLDSTNPPSGNVPTRVNSPGDNAIFSRDSGAGDLTFSVTLLNPNFTVANSIVNGINKIPNQTTGGEGPVTGQEVLITVNFLTPLVLANDHYFFKAEAGLTSGTFLWLSTQRTTPVFTGDLQAWIRNANLDPDWLRAGTDIVGGTTFNAAFSLAGVDLPEPSTFALLAVGLLATAWRTIRRS